MRRPHGWRFEDPGSAEARAPDTIVVLDFGSQYTQLIARCIRGMRVFSRILPFDVPLEEIFRPETKGLVLSGGPASVYEKGSPRRGKEVFGRVPVLGICYGMQLTAKVFGGGVAASKAREYGPAEIRVTRKDSPLFTGVPERTRVWMSHGDRVRKIPKGFSDIARTAAIPAAMADCKRRVYCVQFHPEVSHTPLGNRILANFARRICGARAEWTMEHFRRQAIREIREQAKDGLVTCGVSGGVDSTVMATLLNEALGKSLRCIFVDNGLLRKGERREVRELFRYLGVRLKTVDASKRFLTRLAKVTDPERKRRIIGREFVHVFREAAGDLQFLAQGTLYPDCIESVSVKGPSATIKTHHNRVPWILNLIKRGKVIEPLKELFKDEVRELGAEMGLPEEIIWRQPFPGPGLAVRIVGAVTQERLRLLREVDAIVRHEIHRAGLDRRIWQAFAVLLPVQAVGVMGDSRTYENVTALRIVESRDGMTADWSKLPYDVLERISARITGEVRGVNRVVYDVSSKPPATIEWE